LTWHAVFTSELLGALFTVIVTSGSVDSASLVSDFVGVHPLESVVSFTTVATIILRARDENLWGDVNIWPGSLSSDLDSIGEGRGSGMSPAGTTVRWDMLVSNVGEVVNTFDVVPDPVFWKIVNWFKWGLDNSW
jgi:hypothetical protein